MNTSIIPFLALSVILLFLSPQIGAAQSLEGTWEGHVQYKDFPMETTLSVWQQTDGLTAYIDIPPQGLRKAKVNQLTERNDSVLFTIPAFPSDFHFYGVRRQESIKGEMRRGGYAYATELQRTGPGVKPSYPADSGASYVTKELTFRNGTNTFEGTLTLPTSRGLLPAVILISGSGPQDRDSEVYGFRLFARIAHVLSEEGIAVFRYDDRNTGCSTGTPMLQSTSEDFARDAIAAFDMLSQQPGIDPQRIGILGHSEGGLIAPMVAVKRPEVAFLVLMAGTGVMGSKVLTEQRRLMGQASQVPAKQMEENEALVSGLLQNRDSPAYRKKLEKDLRRELKKMAPEKRSQIQDAEEWIKGRMAEHFKTLDTPWMRFFLSHDPAPVLRQVACPVLLIFGEKDLQVSAAQNEPPMLEALEAGGNRDYKAVMILGANHLFQEAITGSISEYATLPKAFVPDLEKVLREWTANR